jgi:hypothetical protein
MQKLISEFMSAFSGLSFNGFHGVISRRREMFITAGVRT